MFSNLDIHIPFFKPTLPPGLASHMEGVVHEALHRAYLTGLKDGLLYAVIACGLLYFFFLKKD